MKKQKVIALLMASAMTLGSSASVFAAEHQGPHGTAGGSAQESGTAFDTDTQKGSTEFYLNVDKEASKDDGSESEDTTVDGGADAANPNIKYDITVAVKGDYTISATVPLYVCMYGYGGDGAVVAPTSDAYSIKNSSSVTGMKTATITNIIKKVAYAQMKGAAGDEHKEVKKIGIKADGSTYHFFTEGDITPEADWTNVKAIPSGHTLSGLEYVAWNGIDYDFKSVGELETDGAAKIMKTSVAGPITLQTGYTYSPVAGVSFDFGTTISVNQMKELAAPSKSGLALNVTSIKAESKNWTLSSMEKTSSELNAGQIAMSIAPSKATNTSAIDLSTAVKDGGVNLIPAGWKVDAPTGADLGTPGALGLGVKAKIAANNKNESGEVPVVSAVYTISPEL